MQFTRLTGLMLLISLRAVAQDTSFVRSIDLSGHGYLRNITTDNKHLYLRIEDSIYKWRENELQYVERGHSRYSWIERDNHDFFWVHDQIVSANKQAKNLVSEAIFPGKNNKTSTHARLANKLYLCYNGNLLEYNINPLIDLVHTGRSIRHVYSEYDLGIDFRIVSTYSGVFLDTIYRVFSEINLSQNPEFYSNGKFVKIDTNYFLCQDDLFQFDRTSKKFVNFLENNLTHSFRNIIQLEETPFGILTDGIIELNIKDRSLGNYLFKGAVVDAISFKNSIYFITNDGMLGEMQPDGVIKRYQSNLATKDLAYINNTLYIGTSNGLYTFKNGKFECILENHEIIELIDWKNTLIFSNNIGLFALINDQVLPLKENIEFNKHALSKDAYFLYAGSVNGLYIIKAEELNSWIRLNENKSVVKSDKPLVFKNNNYLIYSLIAVIVSIVLGIYYVIHSRKKMSIMTHQKDEKFDLANLEKLIEQNPNIKAVNHLAEHLNTSVVQLNRKLNKQNTKPLKVLQKVKKEICIEMFNRGEEISEISKRVGYSERYIKENFLKD
jgi:AraC-like DNA-binding protein